MQEPSTSTPINHPAGIVLEPAAKRTLDRHAASGTAVVFLVSYVVLEWLSALHHLEGLPITPWNPGLGVAFAMMLLYGTRYGVLLFAGMILAEILVLRTPLSWPPLLVMSATFAACYAAAAHVTRPLLDLRAGISRVRDVIGILVGGMAGAFAATLLLGFILVAIGNFAAQSISLVVVPLFVGDIIGIAVMTPLMLRAVGIWKTWPLARIVRILKESVAFAILISAILLLVLVDGPAGLQRFQYTLFLPIVAAAIYRGIDGACLSLIILQLSLVALLFWYGVDAPLFTEYQALMLTLTTTGLLVGAVVTEREAAAEAARKAEQRLDALQQEATRASRLNLLSGMASALAHDINQPLTAARALARTAQQLLKSEHLDIPRADGNLSSLMRHVDHASGIVRRLREFLARGEPDPSPADVAAALDDARILIEPDCASRRITLDLTISPGLPPAPIDRIQLQQVVINLVRNAIESIVESGRGDGSVRIRALHDSERAHISVSVEDNGAGIPADKARVIFEPLNSSKSGGLGLGLPISAAIVEGHGGKLWLERSAPGATEFRFSLPAAAATIDPRERKSE